MGDSVGVASSPIFPCNNSVISSFSRSLGGPLFIALISSGSARNGASCVSSLGGYQRLFAFTGTLALHPQAGCSIDRPWSFGRIASLTVILVIMVTVLV